ncbi:arsenite efflux ATP-binding protein ArsA [Propionispora vibrioides]|uniref:Arsenite efflux ATP-binding protein ArsA n=2 Tax=Propionispora vibrioides TaxID=112903 RepID=A0A1H8UKK1_9FIRM|nr:arsenite efflux ATP-binding protein ArsA [Propionispora vibrioides]
MTVDAVSTGKTGLAMQGYHPSRLELTKYFFFTGKGGVGKTSAACATAVNLADSGKQVMLISTDPASNLQDVFGVELDNKGTNIPEVPNLTVVNLDPVQAAQEYKEKVIGPYKGILPDAVIANMEEQLSGSCTVEIAAFNEFSHFLTDTTIKDRYEHIIFDTAPTGHTLRMLQLPSAWSNFISENTHGASCLGQLSGLESNKDMYKHAVTTLANPELTTVMLVSKPEKTPLLEAKRAAEELKELGVANQSLILNGVLELDTTTDETALQLCHKQQQALQQIPEYLLTLPAYYIPLRAYNVYGISHIRAMLTEKYLGEQPVTNPLAPVHSLKQLVDELYTGQKKVIFTMGKGGVGKSTLAAAIALGLVEKGAKVHLTTTDPAHHLQFLLTDSPLLQVSHIDEQAELAKYKEEVLAKAREALGNADLAYIEEDLRSPCTQEIAVFRAFAEIVEQADNQVVVIDTAPTGHTLLLLDATQSYHKEIEKSQGDIPASVKKLLPRLRNAAETEVVIVTLPEATPVHEAARLSEDLKRAGIPSAWWIVNSSFYLTATQSPLLKAKAQSEVEWINQVTALSQGHTVVIPWYDNELQQQELVELVRQ